MKKDKRRDDILTDMMNIQLRKGNVSQDRVGKKYKDNIKKRD